MLNNPAHINYGFQYGEDLPPPQAPGNPPMYYPSAPLYSDIMRTPQAVPINTHYTATAGPQLRTNTSKGSRKSLCLCITVVIIILIVLLVAAVLIWYFAFGVCMLGRRCGQSSSCVRTSQWCDGSTDCPAGEDEAQCFRFYGPNFMLQSYSNEEQKWKLVCSDKWSDSIGKRACREIGYSTSDYVSSGTVDPGSSSANGYMALKSDTTNILGTGSVHNSLSSANCTSKLAVTLRCNDCGKSTAPAVRIVGGTSVSSLGHWPWQVSLQINGNHVCGGSVITPSWIVTAAHCVHTYSKPNLWKVHAGYLTLEQMKYSSGNVVSQIISHPRYDTDNNNNNDVALMKLLTPLQMSNNVRPICLPNFGLDFSTSRTYYVTGWGATQSQGSASNELKEAPVSLFTNQLCNSPIVYNGVITESMICAGKLEGGVDSCQGDSGGPLVTSQNLLWWLVGDTSWGQGCAVRNRPGVYGNVTTFVEWIYMEMKKY